MGELDGVTAVALVLIASFVIDRSANGVLFLLSLVPVFCRRFPEPITKADPVERTMAEKKRKLAYFLIAGALGIGVVAWFGNVRLLYAMLGDQVNPLLDTVVTGLAIVAGGERLAVSLKFPGAAGTEESTTRPVEINGKLVLERPAGESPPREPSSSEHP